MTHAHELAQAVVPALNLSVRKASYLKASEELMQLVGQTRTHYSIHVW